MSHLYGLYTFVGLAYQGKDIVFRFIIEYSSLRHLFLYVDLWKMIFWLVLKLEISYRGMISWTILVSCRGFFWRLYLCMVKYLNFHNSSFALRYFSMLIARPQCDTPLIDQFCRTKWVSLISFAVLGRSSSVLLQFRLVLLSKKYIRPFWLQCRGGCLNYFCWPYLSR